MNSLENNNPDPETVVTSTDRPVELNLEVAREIIAELERLTPAPSSQEDIEALRVDDGDYSCPRCDYETNIEWAIEEHVRLCCPRAELVTGDDQGAK